MRILVCGGRDFTNKEKLFDSLREILWKKGWHHPKDAMSPHRDVKIIQGCAKGADSLAQLFAKTFDLETLDFPADWDHKGNAAGSIRNQKMLEEGKPELVVAFPTKNSVGTWDMINRAKKAKVETIIIKED